MGRQTDSGKEDRQTVERKTDRQWKGRHGKTEGQSRKQV